MTDPRFNPATGHGVECLCSECMKAFAHSLRIDGPLPRAPERAPRIYTRVMDDGIETKDGAA